MLFVYVEFDGTCSFLPLWRCAETLWSVSCNFFQIMYYFFNLSQLHCSPRHLFHANYLWPTFRVLWCDGQNQIDLATVDLQLLYVFWEHWVDCDSKTTVCKVSIDLLPARQLLLHCARSNVFACVVPNDGYHNKARRSFCLHAQKEAIATQDQEAVCPNSWGCPFIKSVIFLSSCTRVCK